MDTSVAGRIFSFYQGGFRSMRLGRTLWKIILIKLLIIFGILKLFFFPDYLASNFADDEERARHVLDNMTAPQHHNQNLKEDAVHQP